METLNIGIIERKKELEEEIMEDIERDYLITNFNTNINEIFPNFTNQLIKKKIYFSFILKYINSKKLNDIVKNCPTLNQIYRKEMNTVYIYSLFYIYLKFQLFNKDNKENKDKKEQNKYAEKILSLTNYFKLIRFFYKNQMINWQKMINIFKYIIYQIKSRNNELQTSLKVSTLSIYLKFFVKMVKDLEKEEKEKDQINEEIKKDILDELFEILADAKNNGNYLYFMRNMIKEESIFFFVKILIKSDFLSGANKQYIEENIIKILKNNFKKEHLNYFYKIFSKILIKFNYFNQNLKEGSSITSGNEDYEKNFTQINSDFSFLVKINEILIKLIKEEKDQINNNQCYYCDKGFVFNNRDKQRFGFKVKDIIYTKKSNNNFCILFSFQLRESGFDKENKIIFSIVDSDNNEKLTLFENGNHICIRYYTKKLNEINLHKVEYNTIFNFLFFIDKNKIKISINNIDALSEKASDFKLPDKFQVFIGCPEDIKNNKNKEYSFNGIIYPILLFEVNEPKKKEKDIYVDFKKLLFSVKNKYYLIAEEYFNYELNIKNKKEKEQENEEIERIMHNYEIYYGLGEDLIKLKKVTKLFNMMSNMILYINPYIIVSSFNKKITTFKDYNKYKNENKKEINYLYEFNVIPSLEQGKIYAFRDFKIISFFKTNNGLNFIILQIETLFNYILLLNNKKEYLELPNKDKKNFFAKM